MNIINKNHVNSTKAIEKTERKYCTYISEAEMRKIYNISHNAVIERFKNRASNINQLIMPKSLEIGPSRDFESIIKYLMDDIFSNAIQCDHPGFLAYVPCHHSFISAIASFLYSVFNPHCSSSTMSVGPNLVEKETINWVIRKLGYRPGSFGFFVSGGSIGNLTALLAARNSINASDIPKAILYLSNEAHESIVKSAHILGFHENSIRRVNTDDRWSMNTQLLEKYIDEDIRQGNLPFLVCATAGTTNTGAIDPLAAIAEICDRYSLWFHVDAAIGGGCAMLEEFQYLFQGIEKADSIVLDPHKTMFQCFGSGILLIADKHSLSNKNKKLAPYLSSVNCEDALDFGHTGIELTRPFRALGLWITIQYYGEKSILSGIKASSAMLVYVKERLSCIAGIYITSFSSIGIMTFCLASNEKTQDLCRYINASGKFILSLTLLNHKRVIRLHINNPSITEPCINRLVALIKFYIQKNDHMCSES